MPDLLILIPIFHKNPKMSSGQKLKSWELTSLNRKDLLKKLEEPKAELSNVSKGPERGGETPATHSSRPSLTPSPPAPYTHPPNFLSSCPLFSPPE